MPKEPQEGKHFYCTLSFGEDPVIHVRNQEQGIGSMINIRTCCIEGMETGGTPG